MPSRAVLPGTLVMVLAACGSGAGSPGATEAPEESMAEPSGSELVELGGISLADADLDLLRDALAGYGFEMDAEPDETGSGGTLWTGSAHDGQVEVVIIEAGGEIEQVGVFDYSAGDVGLDELGFLIGIFAPEAQSWLVDQITQAIENPGTELRVREEFDRVTLEFDAFTDETQSLDLWVEGPEGGS